METCQRKGDDRAAAGEKEGEQRYGEQAGKAEREDGSGSDEKQAEF